MRKIMILFLFVICLYSEKLLINSENIESGGYGAPFFTLTGFDDECHLVIGGKGGWIINHKLSIGGYGWGVVTDWTERGLVSDVSDSLLEIEMGAGGIYFEYIHNSDKVFHLNFDILLGMGGITYLEQYHENGTKLRRQNSDIFFELQPGIFLETNIIDLVRVDIGTRYRLLFDIEKYNRKNSDMSGFSLELIVKFGEF